MLCPIPDGGPGDSGYIVPDGGPGGAPAACFDMQSDPNNCGGCGAVCHYACAGGCVPLLLATLTADSDAAGIGPGAVASNGSEVLILTAANGGAIQECGVGGCNQNPLTIASGLDNTNNTGSAGLLALGGSRVYWPGQAAVMDVTTTNPTVSLFAQQANGSVFAVATNPTQVFWSDINLGISSCALGAACASPTVLVPRLSLAAAPQVLAADQTYVYWMDTTGNVLSFPLAGGSPNLLATDGDAGITNPASAMVASAGRVYYSDSLTGELMSAIGGIGSSAAVYSPAFPTTIATDGVALYWSTGGSIVKCALGGSCAAPATIYAANATSLAVDATSVYWLDDGSNNPTFLPQVWAFHK
jgi:hypothetical protein